MIHIINVCVGSAISSAWNMSIHVFDFIYLFQSISTNQLKFFVNIHVDKQTSEINVTRMYCWCFDVQQLAWPAVMYRRPVQEGLYAVAVNMCSATEKC